MYFVLRQTRLLNMFPECSRAIDSGLLTLLHVLYIDKDNRIYSVRKRQSCLIIEEGCTVRMQAVVLRLVCSQAGQFGAFSVFVF